MVVERSNFFVIVVSLEKGYLILLFMVLIWKLKVDIMR